MSFKDLIGNNKIKEELLDAIKAGNIPHSYMFIGQVGIGKCEFAVKFAKMILCLSESKINCDNCDSCVKFASFNHPDFIKIEPEGNSIKIAQMRQMQESIYQKPIVSSKKVFIINDAEKMTQEAQNSLLKTLEEPPYYVVIILIVSNENLLLNTIKSRCLKLHFQNINKSEILEYIKSKNLTNDFTDNMVDLCNGSIGKVEKIKDNINLYKEVENLTTGIITKRFNSIIDIMNNAEILYKSKEEIYDILEYMVVLTYSFINKNIRYIRLINIIENVKNKLHSNCNYDMCIDELLLKMWEEIDEKYSRS